MILLSVDVTRVRSLDKGTNAVSQLLVDVHQSKHNLLFSNTRGPGAARSKRLLLGLVHGPSRKQGQIGLPLKQPFSSQLALAAMTWSNVDVIVLAPEEYGEAPLEEHMLRVAI